MIARAPIGYRPRNFAIVEVLGLHPDLVYALDIAREHAGIPIIITSGKRSPAENAAAGGVDNSEHLTGEGVDIRCWTSSNRFRLVQALLKAGFTRIGIYPKHIHVGISTSLPQPVIWTGGYKHAEGQD